MKKRILCFIMLAVMSISFLPTFSFAAAAVSGNFGEALHWEYEQDTSTLTVSGSGEMPDYKLFTSPWKSHQSSIKNVVIEEGVTSVGSYAFADCFRLVSITFPSTLKSVHNYAFYNSNESTKNVYVPSIEMWLDVDLENSLTHATPAALYIDGQRVRDLVIPEGTKQIKKKAFSDFKSFSSITLPKSLEYVGENAFDGCYTSRVNVPSLEAWLNIKFENRWANMFSTNNSYTTTQFYVNGERLYDLVIPYGTTEIKDYAFENFKFSRVNIPATVTSIGKGAFYGCENIKEIVIPSKVTSIGAEAFRDCTMLESVTMPDSLQAIYDYTFQNCAKIKELKLSDDIKTIGAWAFANCSALEKINLPKNLREIGENAFYGCELMNDVTFPYGLETIGKNAFERCKKFTRVILPDTVTAVHEYAFAECTSIKKASLSNKMTEIDDYIFNRSKILELYIPKSISNIGIDFANKIDYIFYGGNQSQKNILINETYYNSMLKNAKWLFDKSGIECQYSSACDEVCNCCGETRTDIVHDFSIPAAYSPEYHIFCCSVCYKYDYNNLIPHSFNSGDCSNERKCTVCGFTKKAGQHTYNKVCSEFCSVCGKRRDGVTHTFSSPCDVDCNVCGKIRASENHTYTDPCSEKCYYCEYIRTAPHQFGEYVSNNDATTQKDGTKSRVCEICEYKETMTDVGSKLPEPKPEPKPEPLPEIKDTSEIFNDIPAKKWFKEYVDYAVTYGIFTGTSKTTFSPDDNITRAQFVQVLANLEGVDTSNRNVTTSFTDVPAKKWFTPAVKWASDNKIVNGVGGGKFDPNANVTREQMCVMLVNYAKFKSITLKTVESKENFVDDNKISKWAKIAVYKCQQADIVNGKGEGKFDPQGTGTRAEASVIFSKFHNNYIK